MKHLKQISMPMRAQTKGDEWWWTIGGIIAGLFVDNKFVDNK